MIASSSPNTKAASVPQANPSLLPSGSIYDYKFTAGPYAGMTYQEVVKYLQNYNQSVNQATNGKPSKPLTGSSQGDQALGLVGGIGTAAAAKYGLAQLGASTAGAAGAGTGAAATGAGTAAATGGSAALGSSAGAAGSYQLAGTLGTAGAAELGASGAAAGAGAGASAGAGAGAGAASGGAAAGSSTLGTMGAVAWPLAIAATAYMSGDQYENARKASGGASSQADWYNFTHPGGSPKITEHLSRELSKIPGSPSWIANALFGASTQKQEAGARKVNRRYLQNAGLMGPDSRSIYTTQADGGGFDIRDYKAQTGNDAYNINFDGTEDADKIGFADALTAALMGTKSRKGSDVKDGKTRSDMTGELYNSWMANGQGDANARFSGDKLGGRDAIYNSVLQRWDKDKTFTADKRDAALAAIDKQYGIANPTGARWDASLQGKNLDRNVKELAEADKKKAEAKAKAEANKKEDPKKPREYSNPRFK